MKVRVVLEVAYVVDVPRGSDSEISHEIALRAVTANWDTNYKHSAKAESFPPELTGRVVRVEVVKDNK